ncbi:hypothetical protein ABF010_004657, partial [Escherichia coli]
MGKGGGKGHTPREAKDNLKSTQMMSVIDAIGEGPVEGPVKGLQSILVNKTPLTDTDGNPVIHGVTAVWRAGEQEQTPPEGFESSGAETVLGVEVTKAKPVTRTITSANIDRLRVTFGVQSLVETTSKGDRNPTSVRLLTTAITADTEHRFSGLPPGEYTLTVRAINSYGQQGEPATTTFRINAPAAPAGVELTPGYFQITAVPRLAVY